MDATGGHLTRWQKVRRRLLKSYKRGCNEDILSLVPEHEFSTLSNANLTLFHTPNCISTDTQTLLFN